MPAITLADLPQRGSSHLLEGCDYGGVPASLVLFDGPPGSGAVLHRHPYAELFVIQAGRATFTVEDEQIEAAEGHILIAPAGARHKFVNSGDGPLRLLGIHLGERFIQWNEP